MDLLDFKGIGHRTIHPDTKSLNVDQNSLCVMPSSFHMVPAGVMGRHVDSIPAGKRPGRRLSTGLRKLKSIMLDGQLASRWRVNLEGVVFPGEFDIKPGRGLGGQKKGRR